MKLAYIADDGTVFKSESECKKHEDGLMINRLAKILSIPNIQEDRPLSWFLYKLRYAS